MVLAGRRWARAFLFPGQGSQAVGMAYAVIRASKDAARLFDRASAILGRDLGALVRDGPAEELMRTQNAQPALLVTGLAMLAARGVHPGREFTGADVVAGHSLGEWTALTAVGALAFDDAVALVDRRGAAMQAAVPEGNGAMVALMTARGDALQVAEAVVEKVTEMSPGAVCQIANINMPKQVVLSGSTAGIGAVRAALAELGMRAKLRELPVSAPFHCTLMQPAADAVEAALANIDIAPPCVPIVPNIDGMPSTDPLVIRRALIDGICAPVRWSATAELLGARGAHTFAEFGPGSTLTTFIRATNPDATFEETAVEPVP